MKLSAIKGALHLDVRFTPNSGQTSAQSKCPLWAKNGLMQCSKVASYLIALAAVADILRHGTRSSWSTRL
jgi:hypothetical protein